MKYFIDIPELKTNTNINTNVDDNDILPYLKLTYDKVLLSICSKEIITDLLDKYNTPGYTFTPLEKELLIHVKSVMLWGVASEVIMNVTLAVKNKGVQKQNGENSVEVDFNEMVFIRKQSIVNLEMYKERLMEWLCKNNLHCNNCKCFKQSTNLSMFFC